MISLWNSVRFIIKTIISNVVFRLIRDFLLLFLCFKYIFISIDELIFNQYLLNKVDRSVLEPDMPLNLVTSVLT